MHPYTRKASDGSPLYLCPTPTWALHPIFPLAGSTPLFSPPHFGFYYVLPSRLANYLGRVRSRKATRIGLPPRYGTDYWSFLDRRLSIDLILQFSQRQRILCHSQTLRNFTMEYRDRIRRRMMVEPLEARQTTTNPRSTTTFPQPTSVIPLMTTFTPPSSCFDNGLTMMPPPGYMIWANEPVPAANQTVAACYPSEFLQDYTSVSSSDVGSSVVPAMSPFVCPKNYCTMLAKEKNYIACCPLGYQFHPPDAPVETDRPAYGGTCYSDFAVKTNYPVIAYDEEGETSSQIFSASTSGAQAYAHPIDGWALTSPSIIGCPRPTSSPSPSASESSSSATAIAGTEYKGMSTGTVAGAAIGGIVGLVALVALVWFVLVYRTKYRPPSPSPRVDPMDNIYLCEAEGGFIGAEIGTSGRNEKASDTRPSELNCGHGAFEMDAHAPAELDGGSAANGDSKGL